jgi:hypothetical protein
MTMPHVASQISLVESGKKLAYRLRGTADWWRAVEATNGVPTIGPPYTDGQLCALYRVSRTELKFARAKAKPTVKDVVHAAGTKGAQPTVDDIIRAVGTEVAWQALLRVLNEQQA